MTHNSLSSLQDAVDSLIHDGDFETPLEIIQAFVARIVVDPQAIGRVFSAPALDEICLRLGTQVLSQTNVASRLHPKGVSFMWLPSFIDLAAIHLWRRTSCDTSLTDEHVFLMTDILSNPHQMRRLAFSAAGREGASSADWQQTGKAQMAADTNF